MSIIAERIENNILYLELNGRIDSSNAEQRHRGVGQTRKRRLTQKHSLSFKFLLHYSLFLPTAARYSS